MKRSALLHCLLAGACAATPGDGHPEIRFLTNSTYREAGLPFSEAVEVDGWIFLSGVIGVKPGTLKLVPGGIKAEARQVMETIKTTLEAHGSAMDRIVKCTVMIDDMADWPAFNEIYKDYFEGVYPARSALGADGLALGAKVEVDCVARR